MFNSDTDPLFPLRAIPYLRDLRGDAWRNLVDRVLSEEARNYESLAFVLMMVRLGSCTSCQADSYRAMRGCSQCAVQTIRRYRGGDDELIEQYEEALCEVKRYFENSITRDKGKR